MIVAFRDEGEKKFAKGYFSGLRSSYSPVLVFIVQVHSPPRFTCCRLVSLLSLTLHTVSLNFVGIYFQNCVGLCPVPSCCCLFALMKMMMITRRRMIDQDSMTYSSVSIMFH